MSAIMKNVYIVSASYAYDQMFKREGWEVTSDLNKADLVCFTGGADVSPKLYGAKNHQTTHNDEFRDRKEALVVAECIAKNIPMVGICRGGQFLNVMNGGEMYQDVSEHGASHSITDLLTGETVWVSSTHHQMMKPAPGAILVASAGLRGYREWYDGQVFKRDLSDEDIEVVFYPENACLCFQPHPEFIGTAYAGMTEYFFKCVERFLVEQEETV